MDKRKKLKRQVSTDGGFTWQDMIPYEYIAGELIERDSPDCNNIEWRTVSGYICEENTTEMTQWVADTGYVCVGFDKYNKEKEQVSYNSGISWADTGNTKAGSTLIEANSTDCGYSPHDYSRDYLTLEALGNGNMKLTSQYQTGTQYYSKNDGSWTSYTQDSYISVVAGDVIRWKGTVTNSNGRVGQFECTCNYKAYGNILSLLKGDEFIGVTDISGYDNELFLGLFSNQITLMDVSNLILSATTLGSACYTIMFRGCRSLTSVPSGLLPATTLNSYCYHSMFEGCTSLTNAPVLPARTLDKKCYYMMFYNCTSLNSVTCCATDISATQCTWYWLNNVAATGTFHKDANTTWSTGVSGIPEGWTTDTCGCEPQPIPRWVEDTGYVCVGFDKYNKEKEQQSTDGGEHWTDTGNTRAGSTLIESDSTDCGYVPPTPANAKATITYANGDTYDVPLNGSSELTQSEIRRGLDDTSPYFYWNIKSVVILNTVTSIGSSAFYWCREMTSVTVPNTVTTIGQQAFDNCYSLTSVNIPSGVTQIGYNTFHNCRALTSIIIPNTVTTIGAQSFYGCSGLTSVTIGNSVTSIGYGAFSACTSLATITIPNGVTSIGNMAFSECSSLISITIPGSVTSIGHSIFNNCTSLNTVTIDSQSLTMGDYIISGCTSLSSLTMRATTPPSMGWLYGTPPEMPSFNIYVPSVSVNTYKAASGWSRYSSQISAIPT